jgi:signal transduction histidine kinase
MLPYGSALQLDVIEVDLGTYKSLVRRQIILTSSLFAIAIIGVMAGLWIIHRAIARERKLNALKSDFVASISHELRAPIASIRLMSDALEEGKIDPDTAHEFHRLISREGARLSTLIDNVLDFARIEQGKKEWHREETDLRALILDTISLMAPLASEKGITIESNLPNEASAIIDSDAIRQALVNLIDNALKFSPKNSTVKISLFKNEIRVMDHGIGIPKGEHQRIFEKFHRLGGELRRETQGTGIGLSLVKAIAEAHAGSVSVESEPRNGSTFILTLPTA